MGSFDKRGSDAGRRSGHFFANRPLEVVFHEGRLSAEVTHAHAEGIAGAKAVAAATALA